MSLQASAEAVITRAPCVTFSLTLQLSRECDHTIIKEFERTNIYLCQLPPMLSSIVYHRDRKGSSHLS